MDSYRFDNDTPEPMRLRLQLSNADDPERCGSEVSWMLLQGRDRWGAHMVTRIDCLMDLYVEAGSTVYVTLDERYSGAIVPYALHVRWEPQESAGECVTGEGRLDGISLPISLHGRGGYVPSSWDPPPRVTATIHVPAEAGISEVESVVLDQGTWREPAAATIEMTSRDDGAWRIEVSAHLEAARFFSAVQASINGGALRLVGKLEPVAGIDDDDEYVSDISIESTARFHLYSARPSTARNARDTVLAGEDSFVDRHVDALANTVLDGLATESRAELGSWVPSQASWVFRAVDGLIANREMEPLVLGAPPVAGGLLPIMLPPDVSSAQVTVFLENEHAIPIGEVSGSANLFLALGEGEGIYIRYETADGISLSSTTASALVRGTPPSQPGTSIGASERMLVVSSAAPDGDYVWFETRMPDSERQQGLCRVVEGIARWEVERPEDGHMTVSAYTIRVASGIHLVSSRDVEFWISPR